MTAFGFPPHMAFSVPIPTATYFWSLLEVVSNNNKLLLFLRKVPPFVTAHTFCVSRVLWVS